MKDLRPQAVPLRSEAIGLTEVVQRGWGRLPGRGYPLRVALATPYWNGATYRRALGAMISGAVGGGRSLARLASLVRERWGAQDAVLCGSGSLALELALRACGVGEGDEVIVPAFCCTAVLRPIRAAGACPVLADVGEELNLTAGTVEAALGPRTKAVIVPHLFGNPAEIGAITELARARGLRVIDDAAQALGATADGRPLGGFGDAGILSFGSEKVCFGAGGGVVIAKQRGFAAGPGENLARASCLRAAARFFSTAVCRHWRRWTFPLVRASSRADQDGPSAPPSPYRREAMAEVEAAVALTLLETLETNIAARRERARAYAELLGKHERVQLIPHRGGSACLTQVVRVAPRGRDRDPAARLVEVLNHAGFEVQGSYVPIHLIDSHAHRGRGGLARAEKVWADLIELPCEPDVGLEEVERIASIIQRSLR
ncbi:MAG TPA: DegT/DnrJ/EryC1/StrS family aminotransferase [candidate division Zixibacteria bacterium]|nr:DegT/DnrJ/EryC1/StrS family aminotransferase [candidate division Zixibacteria bacterium]